MSVCNNPWFSNASIVNSDVEADDGSAIIDACEFGCTSVWIFGVVEEELSACTVG